MGTDQHVCSALTLQLDFASAKSLPADSVIYAKVSVCSRSLLSSR